MTTWRNLSMACFITCWSCVVSAKTTPPPKIVCTKAGPWTTRADNHDLIDLQQQAEMAHFSFPRPILENVRIGEETLVFYSTIPMRKAGVLRGRYRLEGGSGGFEMRVFPGRSYEAAVTMPLRPGEDAEVSTPLNPSASGWRVTIRTVARGETTGWMRDFRICNR
jgi:hypothetical protein